METGMGLILLQMIQSNRNSLFNSISYRVDKAVVDAGDEWDGFLDVKAVLLTHGHFDHIYGLNRLVKMNPDVVVYTNEAGQEALLNDKKNMSRYHETPYVFAHPDKIRIVSDGEKVSVGDSLTAEAHFTPGHNPGCITWVIGDAIFTGDAYIPGVKTVTNLPGSDKTLAALSEEQIKKLAAGKHIYPGHLISDIHK